jgi:hypothetical protein
MTEVLESPASSQGMVEVLNCEAGHLTFNVGKSDENKEKAKTVITDMLKRGYLILAKVDGQEVRVKQFDPATEEYIIEGPPAAETPAKKGKGRRVKMKDTKVTGIGPTAGG